MIYITEACSTDIVFAIEVAMFSGIILAMAVVSTVVTVAAVLRMRKPTCRVCLYREFCPNRESEHSKPASKPCWSCGETGQCAAPAQDVKS